MNIRVWAVGVTVLSVLCASGFPQGASAASLEDAHQQALTAYREDRSPVRPIALLEAVGIMSIIESKPVSLTDAKYIVLLNDYGFFLSETADRWQEAIPILEKIITLAAKRHVAHLNLGDVYAKALAANTDSSKQADLSSRVRTHYEEYARLLRSQKSGANLQDRVVLNSPKSPGPSVSPPVDAESPNAKSSNKGEGDTSEGLMLLTTIKNIGLELPLTFDGKHLIYSRYDKTGNAKELVFLDPRTGLVDETFGGLGTFSSHYLFSDENYVITRDSGPPHRLLVFDRKTKSRVREIKFNQRIAGAFVRDKTLYVMQVNNPYHLDGGQALTYDLSTGKLLSNVPVIPSNATLFYGEQVILTGHEIKAYDLSFKELGGFPKPLKSREVNSICELGPAKIAGQKLIVGANCGDIAIYDLKTRTLERTIPAIDPAFFNSFDVVGDLLFVAPGSKEGLPPNKARVFDLQTGQEKAILDIAGHFLAVTHDMLLTVPEYNWARGNSNALAAYRMEKDRLVAGDARLKKLMAAYEKAKGFAIRQDSYRAIDVLDEEGLPALLASGKPDAFLQPIAEDYARWLADTFDRFAEAIPMVEWLRLTYPKDPSWALLLSDLFKKQYEIAGDKAARDKSIAAYKEYQQLYGQSPGIAKREFVQDKQIIKSADVREVDIVGGSLLQAISFHEDRAYIGQYGCIHSNGGVSLEVFDRSTFQHLQSIDVAGCDDDYQDNIGNIHFSKTQILLDIGYRYESEDRPNLVVLDKANLTILTKMHRAVPSSEQSQGAAAAPVPVSNGRYEVSNVGGYRTPQLHIKSSKDSQEWDIDLPVQDQGEPFLLANDQVFIAAGTRTFASRTQYILYDVKTRYSITVARLKPRLKDSPVVTTYDSLAFIGFGHDLLILDGSNKRIVHYERDFIPQGFEDNGHGLDKNRIAMLIVDGDRLIARTFYGRNSRILDLSALKKALGLSSTEGMSNDVEIPTFTAGFLGPHKLTVEEDIVPSDSNGEGEGEKKVSPTLVQPGYVNAMAGIAEVEAQIGKADTSNEKLSKAEDAAQTLLDPQQRALAYIALARTYIRLQQTANAENCLDQVAAMIKNLQLPALTTWPRMAQAYAMLPGTKNHDKAIDFILKSRELLPVILDFMKSDYLVSIAEAEMAVGRRSNAREAIGEAFKSLPNGGTFLESRVLALLNIAVVQAMVEGKNQAAGTLQQAFESAQGISSRTTRVQMFAAVSAAQARLGEKQSAGRSLAEAQKVGATIKKDSNKDRVAAAVAKAKAALRQFDEAERLLASNHTGTWGYQEAFGEVAKEEARAGELPRAMNMVVRYTTLAENERVHLVANIAEVLLIALQAGVSKNEIADNLTNVVYSKLAKLQPFH